MKKILSLLIVCVLNLVSFGVTFGEGGNSCTTQEISNATNFVYSPDGKSSAYISKKNGIKGVVVKDGVESKEYNYYNISNLIYSPDSKSFSYITTKDMYGKYIVVKDGVERSEYTSISNLIYSPDSKSFGYIAKKDNGNHIVVKDGVEGNEYYSVSNLIYSPDSKSFGYIALKNNTYYVLVKDGVEGEEYSKISDFIYLSDSKSFLYFAIKYDYKYGTSKYVLVKDGVEKGYQTIFEKKFSLDNKSYSYIAHKYNSKYVLVKDGVEGKEYINIRNLTYSPDSKSLSYIATKEQNSKYALVKDGVEGKEYSYISNLTYSPDSKSFSYIAVKVMYGKTIVVKDGIEGKEYYGISKLTYLSDSNLTYSPDSKSFLYIATKEQNNKYVLVKDGVEGKEYRSISELKYSPDSKSFFYNIAKDNGKYLSVKETCTVNTMKSKIKKDTVKKDTVKKDTVKQPNISKKTIFKINKTKPQLFKQLILSKNKLKKTFKGRKNIKTIDLIVKKLSKQKLEVLMGKFDKIDTSLVQFRKYKDMLDYLESKVGLELLMGFSNSTQSKVQKVKQKHEVKKNIEIKKPIKKVEKSLKSDSIIYYGYGNNLVQELKQKKSGDNISIGTFTIGRDNLKQEFLNLRLKYKENGINIHDMYLYDGLGYKIYGKNTGNLGEIEFKNIMVGVMYGVYGKLGDKLNTNGEFILELQGIDRKIFNIEKKNIGTVKILGKNEKLKPRLMINTFGIDYFYSGHGDSTTFSLTFNSDNNEFIDNIYLDKITLNIANLLQDGKVTLKNLQTLEENTVIGVPVNGNIIFDMKSLLIKNKSNFQIITSAKGTFTISINGITYHTEDSSIYGNENFYQMGTNN